MPSPFVALIIALAAFRLTRLAGWDDFPLAVKIRAWATGEHWVRIENVPEGAEKVEGTQRVDAAELGIPGKLPYSPVGSVRPAYRRPVIEHLVRCPWCIGFWICVGTWLAWLAWHDVIYGMAPFALSSFVGLTAKNLDP